MSNNKQNIFQKIFTFFKKRKENKQPKSYTKKIVFFVLFNSIVMLYGSYILAYLGKEQIAEDLSKTIATTIISTIVGYYIKTTWENTSKFGSRINKTTRDFDNITNTKSDKIDNLVYEENTQSTI